MTPAFILCMYHRSFQGPTRYGITASRKIGTAVDRNRAKRRLRPILRLGLIERGQAGTDYVLIARKECLKRKFPLMEEDFNKALQKLSGK